ncbi:metal-dependent hydrolase [Alcaligenaceae bacterium]|nr:metal-dependent hydrolase [Alcaligenaceae bacterium]
MDSLTQAVLGAGIQGAMLGRFHGRKALVAGALLGTLPDLDVLIDYGDPVLNMINHRGFSHSVFVLTAVAVLITLLYRRWRPCPDYGAGRLFLTIWLVFITHILLDAFTAYGTQLLWPLTPTPTAWSSLFIIDPFYTVPLLLVFLAGLVMGARPALTRTLCWGLGLSTCYLAASVVAKATIEARVQHLLAENGETVVAVFSTPQPFNILLWRVVVRTADDHYIETIISLLDRTAPEHIKLPLNTNLADGLSGSTQLAGLRWFTGDWLRYDAINGQMVASDLRMGLGTGHYSFRFAMAKRTGANHGWQAITPIYWPRERGMAELGPVIRRVWQQEPPLPLAHWEQKMTELPVSSPRDLP